MRRRRVAGDLVAFGRGARGLPAFVAGAARGGVRPERRVRGGRGRRRRGLFGNARVGGASRDAGARRRGVRARVHAPRRETRLGGRGRHHAALVSGRRYRKRDARPRRHAACRRRVWSRVFDGPAAQGRQRAGRANVHRRRRRQGAGVAPRRSAQTAHARRRGGRGARGGVRAGGVEKWRRLCGRGRRGAHPCALRARCLRGASRQWAADALYECVRRALASEAGGSAQARRGGQDAHRARRKRSARDGARVLGRRSRVGGTRARGGRARAA